MSNDKLADKSDNKRVNNEQPYLIEIIKTIKRSYNPNYGDNRECECDHPYYRHFDSYDENFPCGCKYCPCDTFVEKLHNQ